MSELIMHLNVWHWLGFGLLIIILEMFLNSGFLLWTGIAAGVVGLLTAIFPTLLPLYQLLLFGFIAVVSSVISQFFFRKKSAPEIPSTLNRRSEQYIGRIFVINEPIVNGFGNIRVGDSVWRVAGSDAPAGTKIKVVAVDGVILKVVACEVS